MTSSPERLVAHTPRNRQLLMLVGALALIAASVFCLGALGPAGVLIGIVGILFFGGAAVWMVRRMIKQQPTLILDANGLLDQASAAAAGLISWQQVADVKVQAMGHNRMLSVLVHDAEAVLANQPAVRRRMMSANVSLLGTPVNIPLSAVDVPAEDLLAAIDAWRTSLTRNDPAQARPSEGQ